VNIRHRIASWIAPEIRSVFTQRSLRRIEGLGGAETASGKTPDHVNVEGLATALACVNLISSTAGSLPCLVYRLAGKSKVEDPAHPVSALIASPNPNITWPGLVEWMTASLLLRGNALLRIERNGAGDAIALWPIPWERVAPVLLPGFRLAYDVSELDPATGGATDRKRLLHDEVIHLRDRSDDGLIGVSRITRAAETLGTALALQEFSGALWRNGATPSGALKVPGNLSDDQMKSLRLRLEEKHSGSGKAGRLLILTNGVDWQQMQVSPEDSETLATRRFTSEEVARIFSTPPPLVGIWDHSSFTNSETAGRWFASFTLSPILRKIEAEFRRTLFVGEERTSHAIRFDLSDLTRGDDAGRWAAHAIAVQNNILSPDEIREIEGWNPGAPKPVAVEPTVG
jgi:HK97 family phage portal protein